MKVKLKANNSSGSNTLYIERETDSPGKNEFYMTLCGRYNGQRMQIDFDSISKKKFKKLIRKNEKAGMKISLYQLKQIIEKQLPKPGSINFKNCQDKIEIPLYETTGWLELAVEGDPSGMKSGGHELIRQLVGTLVFHKSGKDWELEYFNQAEIEYTIERTKAKVLEIIKDQAKANKPVRNNKAKPGDRKA